MIFDLAAQEGSTSSWHPAPCSCQPLTSTSVPLFGKPLCWCWCHAVLLPHAAGSFVGFEVLDARTPGMQPASIQVYSTQSKAFEIWIWRHTLWHFTGGTIALYGSLRLLPAKHSSRAAVQSKKTCRTCAQSLSVRLQFLRGIMSELWLGRTETVVWHSLTVLFYAM